MISYNNSAPKAVNNVGLFGATEGSIGAYKSAAEYAADAKYWALLSQTKYSSVDDILAEVERLYAQGLLLESDIQQLKSDFEEQNQTLLGLIQSTEAAIDNTNSATELSKEATQQVLAQLDIISNMTVQTSLLPPGSLATGSYNNTTGVFSFGIPEGQPGRDGTDGTISDIGNVSIGTPVSDDYGFYVDKEDGGLYRTSMTEIANLVPSVRSISINGGEEQVGSVSFNSVSSFNTRTGNVLPASGDYSVDQITGAAASGINSDITSLVGLTTAIGVEQGGTGANTPDEAWLNIRPTGSTPLNADPVNQLDAATKRWTENYVKPTSRELFRRSLIEAGITLVEGSFEEGATASSATDAVWHIEGGQCYTWSGTLPKVVPANSTPASSGGISDATWNSVNSKHLRGELTKPTGSGLPGFNDGVSYPNATIGDAVKEKNFRKAVVLKLPFQFSGYAAALSTLGGTYLYPQGADYDDDGLLFVKYVNVLGSDNCVIVVYDQAGTELTWFYSRNSSGQSLAVTGNSTSRRLYDRRLGDDILYYYDITTLPLAGTSLTGHTATTIQSAGSHYCVEGNLLFCTMNATPIGATTSQALINIYALDTGAKQGTINVSQMLTGFGTPQLSPTYYYKVWKMQGLAYKNGLLHIGIGGSYRPASDDAKNPVHDIGVVRVSLQGELVDHSVVKADKLMTALAANGCTVSRTESEGCFIHPDGTVHTIMIGDLANASPSTPNGIVILREFSKTGFDTKEAASGFTPLPNTAFNRLMRAEKGLFQNPVLKTTFTSITEILDLMSQFNLTEFTWFSDIAPTLTPITGLNYTTSQLYTVRNLNNGSFVIETSGINIGYQSYSVSGSLGSWTATRRNVMSSELVLDNAGGAASLTYLASTGKKVGVFRANYSGTSSPLVIGAGGTLTPSAVFIYTNPTITDEGSGVQSLQVYNTAVLPGVNSAQSLGLSSFKWTQVFADTATINTSDARNKVDPVELNEAEKQVAIALKGLIRRYKMKNAVEAKGVNAARYHIGVIAQEVEKAFADAGLNGFDYGILCYDEWDAVEAEYDEEGNLLRAASPAGDGYAIRYEELLCFIIAAI